MAVYFHGESRNFHLSNDRISYILTVLRNGHLGHLYFGKKLPDRESYNYLLEEALRPMTSNPYEGDRKFSLEHCLQEFPVYGSSDYREPAVEIREGNGSRITDPRFDSYRIYSGKPRLEGLPTTYTECPGEAETLEITLRDSVTNVCFILSFTVFMDYDAVARSCKICNNGTEPVHIERIMSFTLDLDDNYYDWIQFSGAWARERFPEKHRLHTGIQSITSARGHSGHMHNPFLILKRPSADEYQGEVFGFSLIYSGNFIIQAEVDTYGTSRIQMGINPFQFSWFLKPGETFTAPEGIAAYSSKGMNGLSGIFHQLYRERLIRGIWRDKERPVLINNWEATYFDFDEERLIDIAKKAHSAGIELFVLDDGWFGCRRDDTQGLGDWTPNKNILPDGIAGLSRRIEEECGMKFGLWFEPEMVNKKSVLYETHPDWILQAPYRKSCHGRHQYVLDFSRKDVVDYIYSSMAAVIKESRISYIKWDMNRSITECYSKVYPPEQQGEIFHRYILGVYDLYDRLTTEFPHILFESCASGGGRFDPGMMFYAPQGWTSDDTDAVERLKIQYGTSYCYPLNSMGAHVSIIPNHQLNRSTPLSTRFNTALFGVFGYEMDLTRLSDREFMEIKSQVEFVKEYRTLIHSGTFYRLLSPFENNEAAWMVVSHDKTEAITGYYKILNDVNAGFKRLKLAGLDESFQYTIEGKGIFSGAELMSAGLVINNPPEQDKTASDFRSEIFLLKSQK